MGNMWWLMDRLLDAETAWTGMLPAVVLFLMLLLLGILLEADYVPWPMWMGFTTQQVFGVSFRKLEGKILALVLSMLLIVLIGATSREIIKYYKTGLVGHLRQKHFQGACSTIGKAVNVLANAAIYKENLAETITTMKPDSYGSLIMTVALNLYGASLVLETLMVCSIGFSGMRSWVHLVNMECLLQMYFQIANKLQFGILAFVLIPLPLFSCAPISILEVGSVLNEFREMVFDGTEPASDLEGFTVAQLMRYCHNVQIHIPSGIRKNDLIAHLSVFQTTAQEVSTSLSAHSAQ